VPALHRSPGVIVVPSPRPREGRTNSSWPILCSTCLDLDTGGLDLTGDPPPTEFPLDRTTGDGDPISPQWWFSTWNPEDTRLATSSIGESGTTGGTLQPLSAAEALAVAIDVEGPGDVTELPPENVNSVESTAVALEYSPFEGPLRAPPRKLTQRIFWRSRRPEGADGWKGARRRAVSRR
jgi:hypothetical protein